MVTLVTGFIGIALSKILSIYFDNKYLISFSFLVTAFTLLWTKGEKPLREVTDLEIKDSLILGLMQGVSVLPGISRSGITIATLIKRGFKPRHAFRLSFFAALPAIFGAFTWEAKNLIKGNLEVGALTLGFIFAFIFGILALKLLDKVLIKNKPYIFSGYCLILGLISLLV